MGNIQLLDQNTIDKIAAGEVVERPASVVKELIENAIDSGADSITCETKDGGISFIRITDNGCGVPASQIRMAFCRHATSKIEKLEDLTGIATLGFRGEALASISAVSKVEMITKEPDALMGIRYCIEGGKETEMEEVGVPSGTTIIVRSLFFNTPARSKFLKSAVSEGNQIANIVEQLALSHPDISFKLIQNGQNRLYTGGTGNLQEIIYQIYGRDIAKELIPIETVSGGISMRGYIGKPSVARGNRNMENYYVNGRYVKNPVIAKAIEDGYHGFMMQHRFPFSLLYFDIDGDLVDVNVHPAKMEVRFSDNEGLYHLICLAVQNALLEQERIPDVSLDTGGSVPKPVPLPDILPEPFEKKQDSLVSVVRENSPGWPSSDRKKEPSGWLQAGLREGAPKYPQTGRNERDPDDPKTGCNAGSQDDLQAERKKEKPRQMDLFDDRLLSAEARSFHKIGRAHV